MTREEFRNLRVGQRVLYQEWGTTPVQIVDYYCGPIRYIITVVSDSSDRTEHYFYLEDSEFLHHLPPLTRLQRIEAELGC